MVEPSSSDARALARSPIVPAPPEVVVSHWAVSGRRSVAALTLCDLTSLTKVTVRAASPDAMAAVLGVRSGRATRQHWDLDEPAQQVLVIGSGPGEWLVLAAPDRQRSLAERLATMAAPVDDLVTVVDLTHGRCLIRLTGLRAPDLLAKECGIDLRDLASPDGCALRTGVSGLVTDVVRDDRDGRRSYLLHCERSAGGYLFDSLLDAGAEFDIDVDGFIAPGV